MGHENPRFGMSDVMKDCGSVSPVHSYKEHTIAVKHKEASEAQSRCQSPRLSSRLVYSDRPQILFFYYFHRQVCPDANPALTENPSGRLKVSALEPHAKADQP